MNHNILVIQTCKSHKICNYKSISNASIVHINELSNLARQRSRMLSPLNKASWNRIVNRLTSIFIRIHFAVVAKLEYGLITVGTIDNRTWVSGDENQTKRESTINCSSCPLGMASLCVVVLVHLLMAVRVRSVNIDVPFTLLTKKEGFYCCLQNRLPSKARRAGRHVPFDSARDRKMSVVYVDVYMLKKLSLVWLNNRSAKLSATTVR